MRMMTVARVRAAHSAKSRKSIPAAFESRFNASQVQKIRKRYVTTDISIEKLARIYRCSSTTVHSLLFGHGYYSRYK